MSISEATIDPRSGHVQYGKQNANLVRFYKYRYKNVTEDYIEILTPGDNKSEMRRPVQDRDKLEYRAQWEAYAAGEEQKANGYPLEQWSEVDEGQIRDLHYMRVFTLEQLVAVSDTNLGNIGMGARELQKKAKAFLEIMEKTGAGMEAVAREDQYKERIKFLETENANFKGQIEVLEKLIEGRKGESGGAPAESNSVKRSHKKKE